MSRKWPFLFAFLAVGIIGCAGSGNDQGGTVTTGTTGTSGTGTTGTTGTGTTGRSQFGVDIPNRPGQIDNYFLPGQGRQASPYYVAIINHVDFVDTFNSDTALENPIPPDIRLRLDDYNAQNRRVNTQIPSPTGTNANSRSFVDGSMTFSGFEYRDASGNVYDTPGFTTQFGGRVNLTTYPGRTTAIQIYLNNGMFNFTPTSVTMNEDQFFAQNADPATGKITGNLSDYLSFDISSVPNKPILVATGAGAQRLFISGDFFALGGPSPAAGTTSPFEVLTPFGTYPGLYRPVDPVVQLKTYELQQVNPTQFTFPPSLITALKGVWYDSSERISNSSSTIMITFPKSGYGTAQVPFDGPRQDFVIITRSGSKVTNMWFGTANFSAAGGAKFTAFPIADLQPASVAGQSSGTLTGLIDKNGASVSTTQGNWWQNVRGGNFTVTTNTGGLPSSGPFVVYRL